MNLRMICGLVFAISVSMSCFRPVVATTNDSVTGFKLRSVTNENIELTANDPNTKFTAVCFLGAECPLAKLYGPRLNQLADKFESDGVKFIGLNSNRQDSEEEVLAYTKSLELDFPMAKDHRNLVADQFGATRTPEVFVIDNDLKIVYRGRIDDQYEPGIVRQKPSREDLKIALTELLSGKPVSQPNTKASGCIIGRIKKQDAAVTDNTITFSNQVSRVLQNHCVECHRQGDIGPFALTDYEEVIGWADMMVEVIDNGRMPPWHANTNLDHFANARHMPESDKQLIRDWVDAGAPFGKPDELPELPPPNDGWRLPREPDLVVSMSKKPFTVPADGAVDYQYFVVDPGFKEDKWVVAAEVVPGNRSVVHHSIVFIRPPDGVSYQGLGWLSAYVPGQRQTTYPAGHGRRIPAGSKFVFQQHYTPTGKKQNDITKVGIVFGDPTKINQKVFTVVAIDQEFEIPPHAENHQVLATARGLPKNGKLLSLAPHMHYRGKSVNVVAKTDAEEQLILDVPKYDFNWQHSYQLKNPLPLKSIKKILFTATFDNSANNPFNPDPNETVYWGDQTWEEMAITFFEVAVPRKANPKKDKKAAKKPVFSQREQQRRDQFVQEFFERFDANNDQKIVKTELPNAIRHYSFRSYDADSDGVLTVDEFREYVKPRFLYLDERESKRSNTSDNP